MAIGIVKLADLPARDVERLKVLLLVEQNGGGLRLTPAGRERYLALSTATVPLNPARQMNWFQRWPSSSRKLGNKSNLLRSPGYWLAWGMSRTTCLAGLSSRCETAR